MIKVRIEIECSSWNEVYEAWNDCPISSVFGVEIDGEFEEFTQEDIEERERAELLERLTEESQEDASEKEMY